jgi:hypothetical protein
MAGTAPFQFATVDQSYRVKKRVCYNVWVGAKGPRIKEKMATGNDQITFVNWDYRPAILVGYEAFAVLRRGEPWKKVDRWDVVNSARVMTETAWRRMFVRKFGHLDVVAWRPMAQDNVPQSKPLPRAKDFDDAARAAVAAEQAVTPQSNTNNVLGIPAQKPGYPSVAALAMGRAQQQLAATNGDVILAQQGKELEKLALEAIKKGQSNLSQTSLPKLQTERDAPPTAKDFDDAARRLDAADLESKPTRHCFPGVMAFVLSRTLRQVAEEIGDAQLMLYAADIDRRARGVIELYLLCDRLPNETMH